jgi:hypothetical protein
MMLTWSESMLVREAVMGVSYVNGGTPSMS